MLSTTKRILICPLDWGLGHTTRCIPIINYLLASKHTVIVACTKQQQALLVKEIPGIQFIDFLGYSVYYTSTKHISWVIAKQTPKIIYTIFKENKLVKKISKENKIDLVISDNRYGCYSNTIPSVFITHQTKIKAPLFSGLINKINRFFIRKYTHCWIPDFENHLLSGELSDTKELSHTHFIGPLSRLTRSEKKTPKNYQVLFLLSGPEPQRTLLENLILSQVRNSFLSFYLVRGLIDSSDEIKSINSNCYSNYCTAIEVENLIQESELVVCRSGYSSLMDLYQLGAKAYFLPTPNQPEQEYLAAYLKQKKLAGYCVQENFDLQRILSDYTNFSGFSQQSTATNQEEKIIKLITMLFSE